MKNRIHEPYNKLKIWLKDKNITYADLGKLLGRTETSITYKINGKSDFLLSEVQLMKTAFNMRDDIFFNHEVA